MKNHYHDTTQAPDRAEREMKAISQEDIILEMYHALGPMSPSQCHQRFNGFRINRMGYHGIIAVPMTSIRRGISNLTSGSYLEKTDDKIMGIYGHMENVWRVAK